MQNKRLILIIAMCSIIAGYFWSQSRVPALNEKAEMGGELQLEDPLAFDVVIVVERTDPLYAKIAYTTVNWVVTNKNGMIFGVLIGAAIMCLFAQLTRKSFKSSIVNSSLGILIGAPLGVCVNCATPIAQGIYSAGARIETALSTMMSSPTMNIIVLTMLFAMFPPYFVAIKLGLTIGFILLGLPLLARVIARYFPEQERLTIQDESCPIDLNPEPADPNEPWAGALEWTLRSYFSNLWWIVRSTVPLMFLAGVLGSASIHILPWDSVINLFEDHGGRIYDVLGEFGVALVGLSIVSSLGIVLPVPMTFDLIIVATLMSAGMPVHYAMALLFTLGIFSIYSFSVIWKDMSRPIAAGMAIVLTLLGVIAGMAALIYDKRDSAQRGELFLQAFGNDTPIGVRDEAPGSTPIPAGDLLATLASNWTPGEGVPFEGELAIERTAFRARSGVGESLFRKVPGDDYGLDAGYQFEVQRFMRPYSYHRPIAAGDVHNDGWVDVAIPAPGGGVSLFANSGGRFVRQQVDLPSLSGAFVGQIALVDLNGDGWLDLFVATYRHGNFVVYSDAGDFRDENVRQLPNLDVTGSLTASSSFGDLDGDGDLEIALGNWARWQRRPEARNAILIAEEGGEYRVQPLADELVSETLSTLFADWNDDGHLDLIIGNEGQASFFYLGDGKGGLTLVTRKTDMIEHTPWTTMTVASADIDNDLVPEIYMGQITGRATNSAHIPSVSPEEVCDLLPAEHLDQCLSDTEVFQIVRRSWRSRDPRPCSGLRDERHRDSCFAYHTLSSAQWSKDERFCEYLPERWADLTVQCHAFFREQIVYTDEDYKRVVPQVRNKNVLLVADADGRFVDRAGEMGIETAGWTWNAKFADVDNDEFQDLFVVNGIFETKTRETNVLFMNQGGKGFVETTAETGVEDFLPTSSYVYVDIDNDGDLDIIAAPLHGPLWVYQNNSASGNAIAFELRDSIGNHFGIGSKVVIHYGDGRHQVRELQAGGGFLSFDPLIAHFGLAEFDSVAKVEVHWSTGEHSEIDLDLPAGATYRITRPGTGVVNASEPLAATEQQAEMASAR